MLKYRADIDGLRAIAVGVVVLFHAKVPGFSGGFVGVDVFFVLSGYLITSIIVRGLKEGTFSLTDFFTRRARRLFPALYAMMSVSTLVALWLLTPEQLVKYARSFVAASSYVSNVYFWRASGYFNAPAETHPLLHTWSLAVEEQFYLITPLLLIGIHRWLGRRFLLALTPVALGSLAYSIFAVRTMPTSTFFLLPSRYWELLLGGLLAVGRLPHIESKGIRETLAWVGLGGLLFPTALYSEFTLFPGETALLPTIGTALIVYVGTGGSTQLSRLLAARPMVFVGLLSYSLYLWHWPVLVFARHLLLRDLSTVESLGLVAVSFGLAWMSYVWVEQPFRRLEGRPSFVLPASAAALVASVAIGGGLILFEGIPQRFDQPLAPVLSGGSAAPGCMLTRDRLPTSWSSERCRLSSGQGPRVLLWGDSQAAHYAAGIRSVDGRTAAEYVLYSMSECAPAFGYTYPTRPFCESFNGLARSVIEDFDIDVVVLSARWELLTKRRDWKAFDKVAETMEWLTERGVEVWVVGQTPILPYDPSSLMLRSGAKGTGRVHTDDARKVNEIVAEYVGPSRLIRPESVFCAQDACSYHDGGGLLFTDRVHLSERGSRFAANAYLPHLRGADEVLDSGLEPDS